MRLIDVDSLGIGTAKRSVFIEKAYADGWNSAVELINQAETVDAAPVVHGRWEPIINAYRELEGWICKCCGTESKQKSNYCPKCGAKMDLED